MKTFPIGPHQDTGKFFAFEIENTFISLSALKRLLATMPHISNIRKRRWFSFDAVHLRFCYQGEEFIVWEPYGDNSRYWIGPENDNCRQIDISELENDFKNYHPSTFP